PFPFPPERLGSGYILCLAVFISSAEKDDPMLAVPSAIYPIPSANINTQRRHAFAHRLSVTEIAGFNLPQSCRDAGFRNFVPKRRDPLDERRTSVLIPVVDEFDHENDCSIKATDSIPKIASKMER